MDRRWDILRQDRGLLDTRPVEITPGFLTHAEGSALVSLGGTRVLVACSVEERVPSFRRDTGLGWLTAEYALLPRSTHTRTPREVTRGRPSGRTQEIQRLIGRSLRSVVDFKALGERTLWVDADVLDADGGTRTAAVTGAFVAVAQAIEVLLREGRIKASPLTEAVAAVSVGLVDGEVLVDLAYEEDSRAEVDMNVALTSSGRFVEIQGTGERRPFTPDELTSLIGAADAAIRRIFACQARALGPDWREVFGDRAGHSGER